VNEDEFVSSDTLDVTKIKGFRFGLEVSRNSLNRKQYASAGEKISLGFDYFMGKESFQPGTTSLFSNSLTRNHHWLRLNFSAERYIRFNFYSLGYLLQTTFSTQPLLANYFSSIVNAPDFTPTVDSRTFFLKDFRAQSFAAGGIRNVFSIFKKVDIRLEGYMFYPFKDIIEVQPQIAGFDSDFNRIHFIASAAIVYHSPLGPISLGGNYYDDSQTNYTILIHLGYIIFNPRSWN